METIFDVTERTKQILIAANEDQEGHPLIEYEENQTPQNILSDFNRAAVRVVNETVYSSECFPRNREHYDEDMMAAADTAKQAVLDSYLSEFKRMGIENLIQYNSQAFSSIATTRVLPTVLGNNPGLYKATFLNGKVCHFWNETISDEEHLCMLMIDDELKIAVNFDKEYRYISGVMAIELKVPFAVIRNKAPITEKHITQAMVTSKALHDLFNAKPDENLKDLISQAESIPGNHFGRRIVDSSFRKEFCEMPPIEALEIESDDEDADKETESGFLSNVFSFVTIHHFYEHGQKAA